LFATAAVDAVATIMVIEAMANPWPEGEGQFQGGILALRFWLLVSYCFNQCFEILFVLLYI
jgi:hypothetical protein